jgi:hypothetical protein
MDQVDAYEQNEPILPAMASDEAAAAGGGGQTQTDAHTTAEDVPCASLTVEEIESLNLPPAELHWRCDVAVKTVLSFIVPEEVDEEAMLCQEIADLSVEYILEKMNEAIDVAEARSKQRARMKELLGDAPYGAVEPTEWPEPKDKIKEDPFEILKKEEPYGRLPKVARDLILSPSGVTAAVARRPPQGMRHDLVPTGEATKQLSSAPIDEGVEIGAVSNDVEVAEQPDVATDALSASTPKETIQSDAEVAEQPDVATDALSASTPKETIQSDVEVVEQPHTVEDNPNSSDRAGSD